jgi:hypothetical protein
MAPLNGSAYRVFYSRIGVEKRDDRFRIATGKGIDIAMDGGEFLFGGGHGQFSGK